MRLLLILFLIPTWCYSQELPRISYRFDKWSLTIQKEDFRIEHHNLRDIITFKHENKSVTAIDLDCDGRLDIIRINGSAVLHEDKEFKIFEQVVSKLKQESFYHLLVQKWEDWKIKNKK